MLTDKYVYKFIKTVSDFQDFKLADTIFLHILDFWNLYSFKKTLFLNINF